MCKNIFYRIEYNTTTKTWNLFKFIQRQYSINFYSIYESVNKKDCMEKLKEVQQ